MTTTNTPNLECRMYESKYPEVDMAVMIQVKNIADMGAYVSLLEYNNIEGMILFSELSRRRIRSVSSLIKVGRQEPVMVLRVDKEKGYIDLSKRRVSEEDIQACEERYNKSKLVHSIMRHVAETMNLDLEELYVNVGWPLYRKYGHAFEAFKVIVTDPDSVLDSLMKEVKEVVDGKEMVKMVPALTAEVKEELVKNIRRRMTLQPLKIRADVEMKCFQFDGVLHIKEAMRRAEAAGNEECPVKIKLVAPPLYVLTTQTLDKVMAPVLRSATVGASGSAPPSGESSQYTGAPPLTGANMVPLPQEQIGMLEIFRELLRNQQQQTEILQQHAVHQVAAPPAPQPELTFRNFRGMQPEKFKGTEGGLQAEEWLTTMASLLRNAGVAPEAQVEAMKIQLFDIAKTWWQVEEVGLEKPVPWEIFEARFLDRFFPRFEQFELEQQFITLKQQDSTVEKYTADFIRLSRFASDLVRDPESKARRYEQGLNADIQVPLSVMEFTSFEAVYRAALRYEKNRDKLKKDQSFSNKRSGGAVSGAKTPKFSKPSGSKGATSSAGSSRPPLSCTFCSKLGHVEKNCRRRLGLCIICGSSEHQRPDCLRSRENPSAPTSDGVSRKSLPSQSEEFKKRQQGGACRQAFTMTAVEAEASDQVITGTRNNGSKQCYQGLH